MVESEKASRRLLIAAYKYLGEAPEVARSRYAACQFALLNEHAQEPPAEARTWLQQGLPVGLLSDGGAAGIADPGAALVAVAHKLGVPVFPQVGPSSLTLALMASGLNGQGFVFHGYPPRNALARTNWLKATAAESARTGQTQLCIEAPYRNDPFLAAALEALPAHVQLCVAAALTLPEQQVYMRSVAAWQEKGAPSFKGHPAVFLWSA